MLFVGRVRAEPAERKTFDHVERDRFPGNRLPEFDRHREDRRVAAPGQPVCKFVSARIGENRFDFVVAHLLLPESELLRGAVVPHRAARAEAAGVVIAADFDFASGVSSALSISDRSKAGAGAAAGTSASST